MLLNLEKNITVDTSLRILNIRRAIELPLQILNKLFLTGVKNSSFFHNEIFLSIVENKLSHCSNVMMSNMSDKI